MSKVVTMTDPTAEFIQRIDKHNFQENKFTIIRLQAEKPLPIDFIREIQTDLGLITNRIGNFTWTKFETWEKALQFYTKYHQYKHKDHPLLASPLPASRYTYEETMDTFEEKALQQGFTRVTVPLDGPPICF